MSDTKSCDEEVSFDELVATYKELCFITEDVCRALEKQKKITAQLQAERYDNLSKIDELHKK
ncbi:envelope-like protein, partial [Trifolium medium]|nr:envelope-like protein [Trifolium medium]